MIVKRTERGWLGHFCLGEQCAFRRNTLLTRRHINIVVSTVGLLRRWDSEDDVKFETLACDRYYETMAFHAEADDKVFFDPDVERQIHFYSPWEIKELNAEVQANHMHEAVCDEIAERLMRGETFGA